MNKIGFKEADTPSGTCVAYSLLNHLVYCGNRKGEVNIYDIRMHKKIQRLIAHESCVKAVTLDADEYFMATGSSEGNVKVTKTLIYYVNRLDTNDLNTTHKSYGIRKRSNVFKYSTTNIPSRRSFEVSTRALISSRSRVKISSCRVAPMELLSFEI